MGNTRSRRLHCWIPLASLCLTCLAHAAPWRSTLYPSTWTPGFKDAQGRFLHDFSYAGYHAGEQPIPATPPGMSVDVTQVPYGADPTGAVEATLAIQKAIDDVGAAGGGIVNLPAGTYQLRPQASRSYCLYLGKSKVVLRGAGTGQTFLYNAEPNMRDKRILLARPDPVQDFGWQFNFSDTQAISQNLPDPTTSIPVAATGNFQVGDWVLAHADPTTELIAELGMNGKWTAQNFVGPIFYRRITAIDATLKTLTIDTPTRFRLLTRDNARISHIPAHLEEIGVEGLSIGNQQNTTPGTGDNDYDKPGTGAYQMHVAGAIDFVHVVNGWIRDVSSYRPPSNPQDLHLLSNGIRLIYSRFITVERADLRNPQYKGAGGNGYMFVLQGNDCLLADSKGTNARHSYSFSWMYSSGNVVLRFTTKGARLPSDFHQKLSPANLVDNATVDNDGLEAAFRDCCDHGHSTTESVFWNTYGVAYRPGQFFLKYIIESLQLGMGYIIGTRGPANQVLTTSLSNNGTDPVDFTEGIGLGDELRPVSLYEDQRKRRLGLPLDDDLDGGAPADGDAGIVLDGDGGVIVGDGGPPDGAQGEGPGGTGDPSQSSGCGCTLAPADPTGPQAPALAIALALGLLLRRRRRPGPHR